MLPPRLQSSLVTLHQAVLTARIHRLLQAGFHLAVWLRVPRVCVTKSQDGLLYKPCSIFSHVSCCTSGHKPSLIWSPLLSRLYIFTTHAAYSPRSNSMSLLPWSFPRTLHSKVTSSFLNIPLYPSLWWYLSFSTLYNIYKLYMCVSQKTKKPLENRNHVCLIMQAKTVLSFHTKVLL